MKTSQRMSGVREGRLKAHANTKELHNMMHITLQNQVLIALMAHFQPWK